jgi:hypothetical protein
VARVAKYTQALPVYVTKETRAVILEIADREEISQAEVVRELIDLGLAVRQSRSATK